MKKFIKVFGMIALTIGILSACGEAEVKKVDEGNTNQAKEEATDKEVKPEFYKVGDTVSVDGIEIKLISAKYVQPAEYSESEKGKIIEIEVSAKNTNSDDAYIDNTEFSIADVEGNMHEEYYGFDYSFSGEIKSGKVLTGKIAYDVPESEKYEIYYEPSFTFSENAEIRFDIEKAELQ